MAEYQRISEFLKQIGNFIPKDRIYTDQLRRLAWGTDAGFYRLTPKIVVRSQNEEEVSRLLAMAAALKIPVTFRAAGTSLSGQAISDSVLIVAGKNWEKYSISPDASTITMQPGILGERVNQILKPLGKRFAPDPASVKSAMVGGIVMNNASGMCCGTHANSDRVLLNARLVWWDGTILDTSSQESRKAFIHKHPEVIEGLEILRDKIAANPSLNDRIRKKYSIKNVVGLNIQPFIMYGDPFEILLHLMVGSEGTLGFMSEMTMQTAPDEPFRASGMLYFKNIKEACRAVVAMKKLPVAAAELLDEMSLRAANDPTGDGLTAVLTETRAFSKTDLERNIKEIEAGLAQFETAIPIRFTDNEKEYAPYWAIRSGIFPAVGGLRPIGTTCLIEDIAFPLENLPEATAELQQLLQQHGYSDACIYGHALEGNYHFIINQSFDTQKEIDRYEGLMTAVAKLVVEKYDGSLKAEHGTGRNMAPYVKYEWGEEAFEVMRQVKHLFDPNGLLNPGVIFNDDPQCHLKNLKPLPVTHPVVDKCIECGFCEINCLTCGLTLSSRQRIVIQREISRLKSMPDEKKQAEQLAKDFKYLGNQTCIADGLCSMSCPMKINTGDLTHWIREQECSKTAHNLGDFAAKHFAGIKQMMRAVLRVAHITHKVLGDKIMGGMTKGLRTISGKLIPLWNTAMPDSRGRAVNQKLIVGAPVSGTKKVVYFPSCINQAMGVSEGSISKVPLIEKMISVMHKGGYEVVFPENMDKMCCGTIWESKGMVDIADRKTAELDEALWKATEGGKYPVLCDQSPCLYRMKHTIKRMELYEPVEFIMKFIADNLEFTPTERPVAVHITCSMLKMGLGDQLTALAKLCSKQVVIPEEAGCCGFGGDKGFTHPEVNQYALRKVSSQLIHYGIKDGYSNSRTCEIGLSVNAKVPYQSIVYLVDECSSAKKIG